MFRNYCLISSCVVTSTKGMYRGALILSGPSFLSFDMALFWSLPFPWTLGKHCSWMSNTTLYLYPFLHSISPSPPSFPSLFLSPPPSLPHAVDPEAESCEFQVLSLDGKVWTFEAASSEEAALWIKTIEEQIKKSLTESVSHKRTVS